MQDIVHHKQCSFPLTLLTAQCHLGIQGDDVRLKKPPHMAECLGLGAKEYGSTHNQHPESDFLQVTTKPEAVRKASESLKSEERNTLLRILEAAMLG